MCYCFTCKRVQNETKAVTLKNFEEEDNPELPKGKTDKAKLEEMTPENKHIILEDDTSSWRSSVSRLPSSWVDCGVKWLNMLRKDLHKKIVEEVSGMERQR